MHYMKKRKAIWGESNRKHRNAIQSIHFLNNSVNYVRIFCRYVVLYRRFASGLVFFVSFVLSSASLSFLFHVSNLNLVQFVVVVVVRFNWLLSYESKSVTQESIEYAECQCMYVNNRTHYTLNRRPNKKMWIKKRGETNTQWNKTTKRATVNLFSAMNFSKHATFFFFSRLPLISLETSSILTLCIIQSRFPISHLLLLLFSTLQH